jgi:hypothetical protein
MLWMIDMAARPAAERGHAPSAGSPVAVTTLAALTLTWAVCQLAHPLWAVAGFLALAGLLVAIRIRWPAFFERRIRLPLRARWRRWSIYRYKWPAMPAWRRPTATRGSRETTSRGRLPR